MNVLKGMELAGDAMVELREVRKQLSIMNVLNLANVRHQAFLDGKHLENGAEMDDEDYYNLIEDLWDASVDNV